MPRTTRWCIASLILRYMWVCNDGPDKQHKARCSSQRYDEGAEDGQSQEVRKDPVTAVSARTLAQGSRQVARLCISQRYTPAIIKDLTKRKTRKKNMKKTKRKTIRLTMTNELQHSRKHLYDMNETWGWIWSCVSESSEKYECVITPVVCVMTPVVCIWPCFCQSQWRTRIPPSTGTRMWSRSLRTLDPTPFSNTSNPNYSRRRATAPDKTSLALCMWQHEENAYIIDSLWNIDQMRSRNHFSAWNIKTETRKGQVK